MGVLKALFVEIICFVFDMDTTLARITVAVALDILADVFEGNDKEFNMAIHEKGAVTGILRGASKADSIHVGEEMIEGEGVFQE